MRRPAARVYYSGSGMKRWTSTLLTVLCMYLPFCATAAAIYPIDRAHLLAGTKFDFKVEFDKIVPAADVIVTINGRDVASVFNKKLQDVENEEGPTPHRSCAGTLPSIHADATS